MLHPEAQIGSLQRGPDQPSWQSYIYQVHNINDKLTYPLAQQYYTEDSWPFSASCLSANLGYFSPALSS